MDKRKAFVLLSLAIALIVSLFVAFNIFILKDTLRATLEQEGEDLRASYTMLLDRTLDTILAMATFIANDDDVRATFLEGRKAVEMEGGGPGGPKAAEARMSLLDRLESDWQKAQDVFKVRQLHFLLGPGATGFLSVHNPGIFGKDLSDQRFSVVDVNSDHTPRAGFELGRTDSGLRGVVPVFAYDPDQGQEVHVGALEVGISFAAMLDTLDKRLDSGAGVVLDMTYVRSTRGDLTGTRPDEIVPGCDCVIEAASREGIDAILKAEDSNGLRLTQQTTEIVTVGDTSFITTRIPLRDYLGTQHEERRSVGAVVFWRDASDIVHGYRSGILFNILYGVIGYLLIEILLVIGFRVTTRQLRTLIDSQTRDLSDKAAEVERLAVTDRLTGQFNRMKLDESFEREIKRSRRYGNPLSVIIVDVDHVKRINDTHGHPVGDRVLAAAAALIRARVREADIVGRWGGEEFLVLCPETDKDGACVAAESLRQALADHDFPTVGRVTASFGVATLTDGDVVTTLMNRADDALYRAKDLGCNRVEAG